MEKKIMTYNPFDFTRQEKRFASMLSDNWLKSPEEMQKIREERKQQPKPTLTKEQYMALHLEAPKNSKKIKGIGLGSFQAVIYGVWYVGIQENEFEGVKTENKTLIIGFETSETIEEEGEYFGKRKVITRRYKLSCFEKSNLMIDTKTLLGTKAPTEKTFSQFDWESLIGLNCILGVGATKSGNDRVNTVSPLIKGMPLMTPDIPSTPPKWVAELAEQGLMRENSRGDGLGIDPHTDNLPF